MYRVNVKPGRFFNNAIQFEEGEIRRVTTFVPTKETTERLGKFTVKPVCLQRDVAQ